jgi:cytochrome c
MKTIGIDLVVVLAIAFCLSACSGEVNGVPEPRSAPVSNVKSGRQLIASYGCGSCHAIPGVPGANSMVAPPLKCFYQRTYIAGQLANNKENLVRWIQNPQQIDPGNAMPDLGVSSDEASDIADYLYDPPAFWGLIPSHIVERKCAP